MGRGGLGFGLLPFQGFPVGGAITVCHAPFPHPAHRTGRADLPHPALGQSIMLSHAEGCVEPPGAQRDPVYRRHTVGDTVTFPVPTTCVSDITTVGAEFARGDPRCDTLGSPNPVKNNWPNRVRRC